MSAIFFPVHPLSNIASVENFAENYFITNNVLKISPDVSLVVDRTLQRHQQSVTKKKHTKSIYGGGYDYRRVALVSN